MSRFVMAIIAIGFLASCDADNAPQRPTEQPKSTGTGITLSGDARVGVLYRSNGTP